jgi:hypothetical protein
MRVSRILVCLFVFVFAVNAFADASRTWVSGSGDDVNPCTFTAPCRTFAGAYVKTMAGGQISVKDVGSFGALTIQKSITIEGGGEFASLQYSSGNAITIDLNANDGSNTVVLRGLKIFSTSGSGYGVFVTGTVPTSSIRRSPTAPRPCRCSPGPRARRSASRTSKPRASSWPDS